MKSYFYLPVLIFFVAMNATAQKQAGTDGNVTFNVTTVSVGGNYSPRHVLAIWIKNSQGDFVISRKVLAASRKQHLVKWVASSGNNSVNAVTGPTINNHTSHTVSWDCRNLEGNLVPDGEYQIWMEYSSRNSANDGVPGPSFHIAFTKAENELELTFPDESYFKQMSLSYVPVGVSLQEIDDNEFDIKLFPNPFVNQASIHFTLNEPTFVNLCLYDASGKRIEEVVDAYLATGKHEVNWQPALLPNNGNIIIRFNIGGRIIQRMLISTN